MSLKLAKIYAAAILSMLFWGLSFVWFKIIVIYYEPITIITLRLLVSTLLLLAFLFLSRGFQPIKKGHLKYFLLLAFTQPLCYFLGESFGLQHVSPTLASVIISTIPLFTPFAAYFIVKEKVSISVVTGLVFSFAGILLMLFTPEQSFSASPKGLLLLFFAVFSAVAYSVIIRKIAGEYNPVSIITYQNLIGAIYFLPLFLIFDFEQFVNTKPDWRAISALLQLSVFASTLAYILYIIAINGIGVIKSNIFTNLIPVFTGFFSYLLLGETFSKAKIAGIILVLLGLVISQSGKLIRMFRDLRKLKKYKFLP
jgi:drug/metabolite transporter (DMT)-like permease